MPTFYDPRSALDRIRLAITGPPRPPNPVQQSPADALLAQLQQLYRPAVGNPGAPLNPMALAQLSQQLPAQQLPAQQPPQVSLPPAQQSGGSIAIPTQRAGNALQRIAASLGGSEGLRTASLALIGQRGHDGPSVGEALLLGRQVAEQRQAAQLAQQQRQQQAASVANALPRLGLDEDQLAAVQALPVEHQVAFIAKTIGDDSGERVPVNWAGSDIVGLTYDPQERSFFNADGQRLTQDNINAMLDRAAQAAEQVKPIAVRGREFPNTNEGAQQALEWTQQVASAGRAGSGSGARGSSGVDIAKLPVGVQSAVVGIQTAQGGLDAIDNQVDDFVEKGVFNRLATRAGTGGDQEAFGRLQSLGASLLIDVKDLAGLGVLAGPDVEIVTNIIGDATSINAIRRGPDYVKSQLQEARKWIARKADVYNRTYGLDLKVPNAAPRGAAPPSGGDDLTTKTGGLIGRPYSPENDEADYLRLYGRR